MYSLPVVAPAPASSATLPRWRFNVLLQLLAVAVGCCCCCRATSPPSFGEGKGNEKLLRLLLDVDNTLYDERCHGIERQIVAGIHRFCASEAGADPTAGCDAIIMTPSRADDLHRRYGSTVEGFRATVWKDLSPDRLADRLGMFYDQVYDDVDASNILMGGTDSISSSSSTATTTTTGYTHNKQDIRVQERLRRLLLSLSDINSNRGVELHLASNSPCRHVAKVVHALGLAQIPWTGRVWTPDRDVGNRGSAEEEDDGDDRSTIPYPTKAHPRAFFGPSLLQPFLRGEKDTARVQSSATKPKTILIDDSQRALEACAPFVDEIILVAPPEGRSLFSALGLALGWLDPNYSFSQIDYLKAKNAVDAASIDRQTYRRTATELKRMLDGTESTSLRIVDVGAGLLSMLRLFLLGGRQSDTDIPPLLSQLGGTARLSQLQQVEYCAYEPNRELEDECLRIVQELGFELEETYQWENNNSNYDTDRGEDHSPYDPEHVFVKHVRDNENSNNNSSSVCWRVRLRFWDALEEHPMRRPQEPESPPHLIVGCCFADLFDPGALTRSLLSRFLSTQKPSSAAAVVDGTSHSPNTETLVYFPITFRGTTQFVPPQPESGDGTTITPSDTTAFRLYSRALANEHGHNLDPDLLVAAIRDYGGVCLAGYRGYSGDGASPSDWVIDHHTDEYLWNTMLYFFGTVAAPELEAAGYDARAWLQRARTNRPTIIASNVDLLFRIPHLGHWEFADEETATTTAYNDEAPDTNKRTYKEIQFQAPNKVATITKPVEKLKEDEVRIHSVCSLISSGTELKVFKGLFDDAALDVNIEGMEEERMAYPLAYGYSLVGRVVECGDGVDDAETLVGKLVFAFAPHGTHAVVNRQAVRVVPDGIDALDAIFMPSVETALSLVHDASPRFGERVVIFGQGLVGLLVTAIISLTIPSRDDDDTTFAAMLTTVDSIPTRLAASALVGSGQALMPSHVMAAAPFDVAIEVSGNARALQSAIDATRDWGRVVIGSWYGNATVDLKLGLDFHRSHKTLVASQVSEIPAGLRGTWDKDRRFRLAWELVRALRPSRLLTRTCSLADAQAAYEALGEGKEIAVAFEYDR